ncbi:MAG TPA: hypothetical protein ENK56_10780 [Chloroflexi bacterium]|nr:hypothetical protein [Chloroflexota bacterium]
MDSLLLASNGHLELPLLGVVLTFSALWFVVRWIHRHLQGVALLLTGDPDIALYLYALLLFPGVLLHELSHWLMARALGVRTRGFSLRPAATSQGAVQLGFVVIQRTDVVRSSLIGLAPLLSGIGVVLLIGQQVFAVERIAGALVAGDLGRALEGAVAAFQVPDAWLWLYLVFAVSNAMLPSASDRSDWGALALLLLSGGALFFLFQDGERGGLYRLLQGWIPSLEAGLALLTMAFGTTLAVDLLFAFIIGLLEQLIGGLRGRRVEY